MVEHIFYLVRTTFSFTTSCPKKLDTYYSSESEEPESSWQITARLAHHDKKKKVPHYDELTKYFSSSDGKKFLDELSLGTYESLLHKGFVNQFPNDLNDITPQDFRKLTRIPLGSMKG